MGTTPDQRPSGVRFVGCQLDSLSERRQRRLDVGRMLLQREGDYAVVSVRRSWPVVDSEDAQLGHSEVSKSLPVGQSSNPEYGSGGFRTSQMCLRDCLA